MNFNSLFFPAPKDHYSVITHFGEMIYIPKAHEMEKNEATGEEVPKLILSDNLIDSQAFSNRTTPKHIHRNSSLTNVHSALNGQDLLKKADDPNRQKEISIVMQGHNTHSATETHATEGHYEPFTQSKSAVSGLSSKKIHAEGFHIPCLLI